MAVIIWKSEQSVDVYYKQYPRTVLEGLKKTMTSPVVADSIHKARTCNVLTLRPHVGALYPLIVGYLITLLGQK
jgi:hypothetical protein